MALVDKPLIGAALSIATLLLIGASARASVSTSTLKRYPTTSATELAFVIHGELWLAPLGGGAAHRLTDDTGDVSTPLFSPDGRSIAFTWNRGGRRDVYVVAATGGEPRRLTYEATRRSDDAVVASWTPDAQRVVFLSYRNAPMAKLTRAFSVPAAGGMVELLPLDRSGLLSLAPGGRVVAYNRDFRNLELRKRYVGGQAQDLYTYDFDKHVLNRLTDWKGTDTFPMWSAGKIYFVSDRGAGFRANIWRYDLATHAVSQVTHFEDFDVDWPSLGPSAITFQQGGRLWAIDLPSEHLHEVDVAVPDDGARTAPRIAPVGATARVVDALGGVDYALSPHGDTLLLSARGDVFAVSPSGARDLTDTPGVDEDHPAWSPDGRTIAYSTDEGGEQQIAVRPASGGGARVLTHFQTGYVYTPRWSPAGDALTVADANHGLWLLYLNGAPPQLVARDPFAEIRDACFSPDGRWVAYSTQRPTGLRAIHLRDLSSGHDAVISSPMESDRNPVFTQDGRLAFISQRNEQPFVSDRDDESLISTLNSDGLYAAKLQATPLNGGGAETKVGLISIDLQGLMARAVALPVTPAVITSLAERGSQVFYITKPPQLIDGDLAGSQSALHALDLATLKDRVVVEGLSTSDLSADGAKVAFRRDGAWWIASTNGSAAGAASAETKLDLSGMQALVDPRLEWAEMFENAWRLDRDVFFSKAMNGDDWPAVHKAYAKLVPELGSQDDFLWLLGQMQGEIASSHTYLGGGPTQGKPAAPTARLGADYALDQATGRYRFAHIYRGDQTRAELQAPLGGTELGLDEGDYLLAINGHELKGPQTPEQLLSGLKGPVILTVSTSPNGVSRELKVEPVIDETPLRQLDWVNSNRARVDRMSGGRIGYVFVQDFDADGSRDFVRQFYPQRDKQGLVIDVRWNEGGFTSQAVLDVLRRQLAGVFVNREGALSPLPGVTAPNAMVTLMNYASGSDGDQFPFFFRKFGLGQLVGERTWGGVQGINQPWRLANGDFILIPKDSLASLDGHWVIENAGVTPDVFVTAAPEEAQTGNDAQLALSTKAVLEILAEHPSAPLRAPPALPAYPAAGEVPPASFGKSR